MAILPNPNHGFENAKTKWFGYAKLSWKCVTLSVNVYLSGLCQEEHPV